MDEAPAAAAAAPEAAAAAAAAATPSVPSAPSASTAAASTELSLRAAEAGGVAALTKVHLLPFAESHEKLEERGVARLDCIAPALKSLRSSREALTAGRLVDHEDVQFAIIKCDPPEGILDTETKFFLEGSPLFCFEKIQFSAWGPVEMTSEEVFAQCISKYFDGDCAPYGSRGTRSVRFFYLDMVFQIGDVYLEVQATEPAGLGVVSRDTNIYTVWDMTPEFNKVHVVPFLDTLPRAYEFDIFYDYLRPYLNKYINKKYQINERFSYHGVEFKVVACDPATSMARIGKKTTIYCEGGLPPSMRNLLSAEQLAQVALLPPGLQMLLLSTERSTRELEEVLTQRRGLFEDTIASVEILTWPPTDARSQTQSTCMICLNDFEVGQECRRLPCSHVFHKSCVDEWLRRCTDCPICKANVDRALRSY